MTWTTIPTVATGDFYTASMWNTYMRDNVNHLKSLLPDASGANLALVSSGTTSATFSTVPDAAMTNAKVNRVPLIVSTFALATQAGFYQIDQRAGVIDGPPGILTLWSCWSSFVTPLGGDYRVQLALSSLTDSLTYYRVINNGVAGTWHKLWTGANDGTGSGLDADTVDGAHAGNATGNVALANGTIVSTLNTDQHNGFYAGNATDQIPVSNGILNVNLNAELHGGNPATFFTKIKSGSYSGNSVSARQITVGFLCKFVLISSVSDPTYGYSQLLLLSPYTGGIAPGNWIQNRSPGSTTVLGSSVVAGLHASDGFVVDTFSLENVSGITYYYIAFG